MSISWQELQNNRSEMPSIRNSAHMLECIRIVKQKYQHAGIADIEPGESWGLADGDKQLSSPHTSHYECWAEARAVLDIEAEK